MPPPADDAKTVADHAILVVDDDVDVLRFLRETVSAFANCRVDTSPSAEYAFELSLRKAYDLFLFDFSMPAMDGAVIDLAVTDVEGAVLVKELKNIRPGLPVVAITVPRNDVCDGADYLMPSFEPASLLQLLQTLKPEETAAIERNEEDLAK